MTALKKWIGKGGDVTPVFPPVKMRDFDYVAYHPEVLDTMSSITIPMVLGRGATQEEAAQEALAWAEGKL